MTATLAPETLAPSRAPAAPVITIARTALRTALTKLLTVADTSARALPVAQHIRLDARDGSITLSATNFEAWVRLSLSCELDGEGVALLPAKMLAEIVANLPASGALTIRLDVGRTIITAGRSRFEIAGLAPDEFPNLPAVESQARVVVRAAPFLDACARVLPHTSDAESRPALQGVSVESEDGALLVVGCEGSSLARLSGGAIVGQSPATGMGSCLIHRAGIPILSRVFGDLADDATVTIAADASRLQIETDGIAAQVRLVDHPFPAYRQLISQGAARHVVVCDRAELAAALRRVGIATDEHRRLEITLDGDIAIRGTRDIGTASDAVAAESHTRPADDASLRFGMNASLIGKALTTLTGERVELSAEAPERAVFLRDADQSATDPTLLLVMPLRLL